jgi:hypothetical protein
MRTNKHDHMRMLSLYDMHNIEKIVSWNEFSVETNVERNCVLF